MLRETGMNWTSIASCLGVHARTLYRRRMELNVKPSFTAISDTDLDVHIRDVLRLTPFAGESLVKGSMQARGVYVPRWKLRERLTEIDPIGRALR